MIAYCGLDCDKCEARIATINNDEELRDKVAKQWSKLNNVEITKDMINCLGCRQDGIKTPYCGYMCEIRKCACKKNIETCASCENISKCKQLNEVLSNSQEAQNNLKIKKL